MSESSRKEFIDRLKGQLDDIDANMGKIEKRADELEGEARKEYEKRLNDLREDRRKAQKRIDDARAAGEEQWQEIKDDAEHAWKALGNSFNYFKSHFK
ncbi:MAG: hypothetical protein ABR578_00440 [Chromatocurvus sp.]